MKESIYKNAYNFINNGPIWNPLALLELSQSPLCISLLVLTLTTLESISMYYKW